jgi:endonuclease-8
MPEGDTVHGIARRLQPLVGKRLRAHSPHPRGAATGVAQAVDGRLLEDVEAIGKHLVLRFEGGVTVHSHLRMRGRWTVGRSGAGGRGRPWLVLAAEGVEAVLWNGPVLDLETGAVRRLGPDLLAPGFDAHVTAAAIVQHAWDVPVGEALLDQRLVAGIGNRWLAEGLWQARLSPWTRVCDLAPGMLAGMLAQLADAMGASVAGARRPRAVYRRTGRPCPRCETVVRSRGLGEWNRTAYWCPGCQPSGPAGEGCEPARIRGDQRVPG